MIAIAGAAGTLTAAITVVAGWYVLELARAKAEEQRYRASWRALGNTLRSQSAKASDVA